jgi:WSC domain
MMQLLVDSRDMTISKCIALAAAKGLVYAALQDSTMCFASNAISSNQVKSTACAASCSGAVSEVCGGHCARDVYAIPTPGDPRLADRYICAPWLRLQLNAFPMTMYD